MSGTEEHALWIGSKSKVTFSQTTFSNNRNEVQRQTASDFDGAVINTANEGSTKAKLDGGAQVWFVDVITFEPDPADEPMLVLVDLACNAHLWLTDSMYYVVRKHFSWKTTHCDEWSDLRKFNAMLDTSGSFPPDDPVAQDMPLANGPVIQQTLVRALLHMS